MRFRFFIKHIRPLSILLKNMDADNHGVSILIQCVLKFKLFPKIAFDGAPNIWCAPIIVISNLALNIEYCHD